MYRIFGWWITAWVAALPIATFAQPLGSSKEPVTCPQGANRVEEATEDDALGEWCEKDGVREGPYRLWNQGLLSRTGEFKQGRMTGNWKRYSKTGQLTDEGAWRDNRPEGVWTFYDAEGRVSDRIQFQNGERVSTEPDSWTWKRGQLLGARIFQESGGQVGTAFISFVPGKKRGPLTEWIGALSLGGLKSRDPVKPLVWVLTASGGMRFRIKGFESFRIEPRVGVHSWVGSATASSVHLDTGYEIVPGRTAIVAGLERVSFKVNSATLLRFGLEYRIGD